jgi:hypothetical protein
MISPMVVWSVLDDCTSKRGLIDMNVDRMDSDSGGDEWVKGWVIVRVGRQALYRTSHAKFMR